MDTLALTFVFMLTSVVDVLGKPPAEQELHYYLLKVRTCNITHVITCHILFPM
ncbi:hypothetical protein DPMN_107905 [Dreissena polymorpha]|uniref:Uncharacterized protein n=1 Tax=Dreissena polymorpha TaxID=45954 RepID=A0A9D4K7J9_DREPO|nr:hypothetical protein DPMN_107905 [Dreissena polymorpha]